MIPTAHVERAHSYRARSASKGIVPATPFLFFSILLDGILKGRLGPNRMSQNSTMLEFLKNSAGRRIKV